MDLKFLVALAIVGVAAGSTTPIQGKLASDLEVNFPSSYAADPGPSHPSLSVPHPSQDEVTREKRDLFKKFFKGGHESVIVNNRYEQGSATYGRPGREVHHHHYETAPPTYVHSRPNEYHHYHGYEGQQYYHGGNYYGSNYGGYYAGYNGVPPQSGPIGVKPQATGHNAVDRGQGAAAVNNIAIIHARKGQTGNNDFDNPIVDMESMSREGF